MEPMLEEIQSRLIDLMASVATPRDSSSESKLRRTTFSGDHVLLVEEWIDQMDAQLPPLTQFILPSGGLASSSLHVCRAVCRRAERETVELIVTRTESSNEDDAGQGAVEPEVGRYLNRLSDFFFAAARTAAHHDHEPEVAYKKDKGKTIIQ